jgi:hypothetical protein
LLTSVQEGFLDDLHDKRPSGPAKVHGYPRFLTLNGLRRPAFDFFTSA